MDKCAFMTGARRRQKVSRRKGFKARHARGKTQYRSKRQPAKLRVIAFVTLFYKSELYFYYGRRKNGKFTQADYVNYIRDHIVPV